MSDLDLERARQNVLTLFTELAALGYRFEGPPPAAEPDHPLELRLEHALQYVREHGGANYGDDPWSHPALAWVEEEEIALPAKFQDGRAVRFNYRPPSTHRGLFHLTPSLRAWFETVGSVDLKGSHPVLNPDGGIEVLRVTLDHHSTEADLFAYVRHAFAWGGFPGWSEHQNPPKRELDFLRGKLLPL